MKMSTETTTHIISCGVFKPALDYIRLEDRYRNLRLTYLPSNLHLRPQGLRNRLRRAIASARKRNERVMVLCGDCFPGINDFCKRHGVIKVPGHYCYEMLLGPERFQQFVDEVAGTYFLERDLILNFEECCVVPLELYDEEVRRYCFEHYQRLLYVRQPADPDLVPRASELAKFLELALEIGDADYSYLERKLIELI